MIVNKTPHSLTILKEIDNNTSIFITIPPTPPPIRLKVKQYEVERVNNAIPLVQNELEGVEGVNTVCENCKKLSECELEKKTNPIDVCKDQDPINLFVVSSIVAMNIKRNDFISPDTGDTAERDEEGNIIAIRRFQKW